MDKKINELINQCRKFTPLDGRVLVHALKLRTLKQKDYSFDVDNNSKANEGKDATKHRVDLKKIQPKVNAKYQEAVVLQVPFDESRFKPGDSVIYPIGLINDFDLVKGVSILRKYDIACVMSNTEIDNEQSGTIDNSGEVVGELTGQVTTTMAGYSSVVS